MTAILSETRDESGSSALGLAQRGDHDAFAALVSEHEAMVWSIGWHFFRDRGRAEEIAQDVFLQLYRKLGEITSPSHLLFWLRQVTARRCIDQTRKSRLRAVSLDEVRSDLTAAAPSPDPLRDRLLRELIAGLPEMQRVVVTLRYQEDLDPLEICRLVDMPVNTVKSHLHRALQALRKKLGEHS
jgi:RNA polymerase sigma-70 factor (ECF subfamily)